MKKYLSRISILLSLCLLLSACASDRSLNIDALKRTESVKVVWNKTPDLRVESIGGLFLLSLGGLGTAPVGEYLIRKGVEEGEGRNRPAGYRRAGSQEFCLTHQC